MSPVVLNLDRCSSCGKYYRPRDDQLTVCLKCWEKETLAKIEQIPTPGRIQELLEQ